MQLVEFQEEDRNRAYFYAHKKQTLFILVPLPASQGRKPVVYNKSTKANSMKTNS